MKYPQYLSFYGYCNDLVKQYESKYCKFFSKEDLKNTIDYMTTTIVILIDQNDEKFLNKIIQYLSSLEHMTQDEYTTIVEEITPRHMVIILFGAAKKNPNIIKVMPGKATTTINDLNKEQYLEFLQEMILQSSKELALINDPNPKKRSGKKVIFNENFALGTKVREYMPLEELTNYKELSEIEKSQWLNRSKQDFKAYLKRERRRDLQALSENAEVDTETAESTAKKFRVNVP